ncbi:MAG: cytochrome c biogenesis protein ResB [Thermoanaerobaculia bacterium]
MSTPSWLRRLTSVRTTLSLLCLLALLLLLNVALPQRAVLGEEQYARVTSSSGPIAHFFLETLGFGHMATSPVFVAVLALFFLNLGAVLAVRLGPTWRRVALRPRSEEGLKAWARMEESFSEPLPEDWEVGKAVQILRGFGFQVRKAGERTMWGVKHRTAPLGFLLFHLSFFLLCAGGVLIYYTRFVGVAVLSEGQQFTGSYSEILRQPPTGRQPDMRFAVEEVDTRLVDGRPVHLQVKLLIQYAGGSTSRTSRVNHPARWGDVSLLVGQAGLAPVLWLQDPLGFTLDRLVTPARTRGGPPTEVPLAGGRVQVLIHPLSSPDLFPSRDERSSAAMRFQVLESGELAFDGELQPGEAVELEQGRLVLEDFRYWIDIKVISERGGGLLITGFVIGILGLVWRLLWYRREVAITWDEERLRLVGRSEYFSKRFRDELEAVFSILKEPSQTAR